MSDDKQKGGGQQKALSGFAMGGTIAPTDVTNAQTMSGWATLGIGFAALCFGVNKLSPLVARIFGVKPGDKPVGPSLGQARGMVFQAIKEGNPEICNDSALKGIMKEGWSKMTKEGQDNLKGFIDRNAGTETTPAGTGE